MGKKVSNKRWFQLHGWFTLPVWVLFCFICLTGTLAVVSHEITWLVNENARADNPESVAALPMDDITRALTSQYPTADITGITVREPYLTYAVMFTDVDKPYAIAYINQYTGEVQEINDGQTFIDFMRSLHGWLLFPWQQGYSIGYYLVSLLSVFVLGAVITGMMVYKKFWRAFTRPTLRFTQGTKTLLADLHKTTGAWSIWFLLIMGITGLWYLIQGVLWHNEVEIEPWPASLSAQAMPDGADSGEIKRVSLNQAMATARQRYPDLQPSFIMLPEHNRDTYKISGDQGEIFYDQYSYRVAVNPYTGEVTDTYSPTSMAPLQTVMHLADRLHFGTVGGIVTKAIWFVFGLLITGMSITGFWMWRSKLVSQATSAPSGSTTTQTAGAN